MKKLVDQIENASIPDGSIGLWWLGQAGFVFKSDRGKVIYLDPYLSDVVERIASFKRLSLAPIDMEDVRADCVICSHEHPDHLDSDALEVIAKKNPECIFAGSTGCVSDLESCGISDSRILCMGPGGYYTLGGITVHTARADHGDLSPSALSILLDFGKIRVMFSGDTSLNLEYLDPLIKMKPDVLLPCINGSFGNMNAQEAANLASIAKPMMVVPCHFWMFKEHHVQPGGDPHSFFAACESVCPQVMVQLLTPGGGIVVSQGSVEPIG